MPYFQWCFNGLGLINDLIGTKDMKLNTHKKKISHYYKDRGGYTGPYYEYEKFVLNNLKSKEKLLDVGCGRTFPMAKKWAKTGAEIYGVDPVAETSLVAPNMFLYKCSAEQLPFEKEYFDMIISCAVFEHIQTPLKVLKEFNRVLKPGGKIVFLTPSKYDYVSVIARLVPNSLHKKIVRVTEGRREDDTFPTYYRANTFKNIRMLAKNTDLDLEDIKFLDQSPYAFKFSNILYACALCYHNFIRSFRTFHFLKGWILCVIGKESIKSHH
jgi:ubiquinone/menaquinone biosynthesis C-methylase UbiE